jgi:glycosyltransferase involved in cell wall biosynthesis
MAAAALPVPRVSIGLPVYNGAGFLRQAIDSLLAQSFTDFELIISDNASSDGTEGVCREIAAQDARVRYSRLAENIGGVANHNRVAALATGRYFMWAASDDYWRPDYVQRCVDVLDRDAGVVVAFAINALMNDAGETVRQVPMGPSLAVDDAAERFRRSTEINRTIEPFYGLIRRSALQQVAPMVKHPGFDRIAFAELALVGKLHQIAEPLYVRRIHAGQSVGAYPSLKSRYRWISPGRNRRFVLPHLEYAAYFAGAVLRSAPSMKVRAQCLVHLAKWCNWHRGPIWRELVSAE